ncbi:GOLPH3/VPS74 family protein [Rugosimonospora acidiphila]
MVWVNDVRGWPPRLWLADDFWLIAHHDSTGRPRLGPVALQLGAAGALLGELVLSKRIVVAGGQVRVVAPAVPSDAVACRIVDQLLTEPEHELRTWLRHLSHDADRTVAARLVRAGLVVKGGDRRLFRTAAAYRPVDSSYAFWRSVRLKHLLADGRGQPDWSDVLLAGLIHAAGLFRAVLWEDAPAATVHLRSCLARADPSVRELIAQVGTLVGDAVLAARG